MLQGSVANHRLEENNQWEDNGVVNHSISCLSNQFLVGSIMLIESDGIYISTKLKSFY